jgi:hypothetical protein
VRACDARARGGGRRRAAQTSSSSAFRSPDPLADGPVVRAGGRARARGGHADGRVPRVPRRRAQGASTFPSSR